MVRLFVVDDHEVVREGVRRISDRTSDIRVVDEAETYDEVLERFNRRNCNLVLLDMVMPGAEQPARTVARNLLEHMRSVCPEIPVMLFSGYMDETVKRAFANKVDGLFPKQLIGKELVDAIRKIHAGGKYLPPHLWSPRAAPAACADVPPVLLSHREARVALLIAEGLCYKEIADRLDIGLKTVCTYRTRALEKIGGSSTADLIRYVCQHRVEPNADHP